MPKRKIQNKIVAVSILSLFCLGAVAGIALTLRDYVAFRDGERVQATVTNVRFVRRAKGRSRTRIDTTVMINGEEIRKVFRVPNGSLQIGNINLLGDRHRIEIGSMLNVMTVKKDDVYEFAIADDVLNPWSELIWLVSFLTLGIFSMVSIIRQKWS